MQELIETIRTAVASDASKEQKAAGATACRTILAALDTEPGKPFVIPGAAPMQAMPRVSLDQVLDLMIARLATIANEREARPSLAPPDAAASAAAPSTTAAPATAAPAVPPVSRGLRVPMAAGGALKVAARSANAARPGARKR